MDVLSWMLDGEMGREKLALIACCVLAIPILADQFVWRLVSRRGGGTIPTRLRVGWVGELVLEGSRLLVSVGVPVAVLWRGALYPEMGIPTLYAPIWRSDPVRATLALIGTDGVSALGRGAGICAGVLVLLLGTWVWYERKTRETRGVAGGEISLSVPLWEAARGAISAQLLWALYRGVALVWIPDRVYAVFLGLGMVGLSCALSPICRARLSTWADSWVVVQDWALAVGTALAALAVRSVIPLIVFHALFLWISSRVLDQLGGPGTRRVASLSSLGE